MQSSDQPMVVPAPEDRSRRLRRAVLAAALGSGLALGAAGIAYADDASTAPSAPAADPSGAAPVGPPARPDAGKAGRRPHLDGTVTKLSAGKIMIVDGEGFTRQINIATAPKGVAVGTRVHAEGTVDSDGVSLDAASVVAAPAPGPVGPGKGPAASGPRPDRKPPAPGANGAPPVPAPRGSGGPAVPAPRGSGGPAVPAPRGSSAPAAPAPGPSGSAAAPAPSKTS